MFVCISSVNLYEWAQLIQRDVKRDNKLEIYEMVNECMK